MGFRIVNDAPKRVWAPVSVGETLYVGQLVKCANEGVAPLGPAEGLGDRTNKMIAVGAIANGAAADVNSIPYGIIVGTNQRNPTHSTTSNSESIVHQAPSSATINDYFGVEGPWAKGDLQPMVEVALIDPSTVIRGDIRNAAINTGPTVVTIASGASTLGATTGAVDATPIQSMSTAYFRTGSAAGSYRVVDAASTTAHTWDNALTSTCAVGDTLVVVNGLRPNGIGRIQMDAESLYIDISDALDTNYMVVNVHRLDLSEAGLEYVEFTFNPMQFLAFDHIV